MSQRLNEYFAGEAADYLQQLAALLALPVPPDPVRLLRLATGVRGSTQMAGADDLADLASHFESSARQMLQGSAAWSDDIRDLSRRTVSEMQALVYSIDRWGDEEASRIRAVSRLWSRDEQETDDPVDPIHSAEDVGLEDAPDAGNVESAKGNGAADHAERAVVPIDQLFFDDAGPHILESEGDDQATLTRVPIESLLYDGRAALRAAAALRPTLDRIMRGESTDRAVDDILDELFDLIDLASASAEV